jgi:hypothetical protein
VFYEFPNGVRAVMAQRQISNCYSDNSDFLTGSTGVGTCGWDNPMIRGATTWRHREPRPGARMYQNEHDELFASIRKEQPINDGVWMAHSTLAAILGRTAAYTGQRITWEQILTSEERLVPEAPEWNMKLPIAPMAAPGKTKFV